MVKYLAGALCGLGFLGLTMTAAAAPPSKQTAAAPSHETLIWSDEFNSATGRTRPDPANWNYRTGGGGWGNGELETYCGWGSNDDPCDASQPNAWVGHKYLHLVARSLGNGVYTSARISTRKLRGFRYGRIEARIKIPRGQGMWPAFWMLGDDIATAHWPACGEIDILENIGRKPATLFGSIHGTGFTGHIISNHYTLPGHAALADAFHVYGILWSPKKIQFYIDDPSNVYATETPADLPMGAIWPFDGGKFFILLNVAVGGEWPGPPDATTHFPQQMLVDYIRVYKDQPPADSAHRH